MKVKEFHINNSLIQAWIKCPRRAFLSYIQPQSVKEGTSLPMIGADIGTCVHAALAAYYNNENIGKAIEESHSKLGLPEEGKGCIAHIDKIVSHYLKRFKDDNRRPVLVEETLTMPLSTERGIYFRGTIDLALENDDKSITLVDHKTGSNVYQYVKPIVPFNYQFTGYQALYQYNNPDKIIDGFEVHAIGSNPNKTVTTVYETSRDDDDIEQWKEWVLYWANEIIDCIEEKKPIVANMGEACVSYNTVCPFARFCQDPFNADILQNSSSDYQGFILDIA